jgi:DNA mismatch repair ATPase MutL
MRKVVNEVYSSFNRGHYCTLVLFVEVDPKFVDPNLTPDKRKVFLKNEKEVFAKLRACLVTTFMSVGGDCRDSKKSEPKESSKRKRSESMFFITFR